MLKQKLQEFRKVEHVTVPPRGWVHEIRRALNLSLRQLGGRMHMSVQGVKDIEDREQSGSITLKALRKAGKALNMKLVYGFIPEESSLDQMIEDRARELADENLSRRSRTTKQDNQKSTKQDLKPTADKKTSERKDTRSIQFWD